MSHVVFTDVGKTGILPGPVKTKQAGPDKVEVTGRGRTRKETGERGTPKTAAEPVPAGPPLRRSHAGRSPSRIAGEGRAARSTGPTLVHFTRNVVVRRGKLSELPDQLDTDNLDLILVPAEKTLRAGESKASGRPAAAPAERRQAARRTGAGGEDEPKKLFGDLTLRRVKATGHAVWLRLLPLRGSKIRCNELIHEAGPPGGQRDLTYFRGDPTRSCGSRSSISWRTPRRAPADRWRKLQSITQSGRSTPR